jgi:hypothetical protein
MKIDELLAALAVMRNRLMRVDTGYTADSVQTRLAMIGYMRTDVLTDSPQAFTDYCQRNLATSRGDLMLDLLEELYEELGLARNAWWDEFENKFLIA